MSRPDLLALSPQSIAALSNLGLVKRAQRELEQGKGPKLEELADGTVVGVFEDGNAARLIPGKALRDSPCTCGASGVCRHRVSVALAYPAFAATGATAVAGAPVAAAKEAASPVAAPSWSPGSVTDEVLSARLPSRIWKRALALRSQGFIAKVRRGSFAGDDLPTATLATCTLRFLVADDLGYARCDCTTVTWCEHLPLAVWAFRAADARDPQARELTVEVAEAGAAATVGGPALDAAVGAAELVVLEGVQHLPTGAGARFAMARGALEQARMAWLESGCEDLEELVTAYHRRGAAYGAGRATAIIAELFARARAARTPGEEPPRSILGMDEAPETRLDHLRLVSLGARVHAQERDRAVELLLADPAAASLLVLRRSFTFEVTETPEDGPALSRRSAFSGATLESVARGQIVTSGGTRRPNRALTITSRGLQRSSVTPQSGDWSVLPSPILVGDVRALEAELRDRPPRYLRPRLFAENVHAFVVSDVRSVRYVPGDQAVHAELLDGTGHPFRVELRYRSVTPGAVDALARALQGRPGKLRYLSGDARRTAEGLVVEPSTVVCEGAQPIALDFQPPVDAAPLTPADAPRPGSALGAVLAEVEGCLGDAVHRGLRHLGRDWRERLMRAAERAGSHGLTRIARDARQLSSAVEALQVGGRAEDEQRGCARWSELAIRVAVSVEQLSG